MQFNFYSEVRSRVDQYMKHYNEERIQEKLGYQSPIEYKGMIA
ncbi:IS3 family transposase [Neobacillus sp.]